MCERLKGAHTRVRKEGTAHCLVCNVLAKGQAAGRVGEGEAARACEQVEVLSRK